MSQEDKCTETLEGDKIGCIYSVMIKMATTTNVQETTEDRRRQKYRKNNPKLVQLSNFKFSAKVSRKRQVDTDFDREYKAKEAARKRRYRAQRTAAASLLPSQVTMRMMDYCDYGEDDEEDDDGDAKIKLSFPRLLESLLKAKRKTLKWLLLNHYLPRR